MKKENKCGSTHLSEAWKEITEELLRLSEEAGEQEPDEYSGEKK